MLEWRIYYNPNCSKSQKAISLLEENGIKPLIIDYLKTKPGFQELKKIASQLKLTAPQMIRKKETLYQELRLDEASDRDLFEAMSRFPELIERPIVLKGHSEGIIARPPENILKII